MWYWEYTLKIWDDIDSEEVIRSGVICADNYSKAMEILESYYGDEILDVLCLKTICDVVFDFEYVTSDTDFDFEIKRKEGK